MKTRPRFSNKVFQICSASDSWELLLFDEVTTSLFHFPGTSGGIYRLWKIGTTSLTGFLADGQSCADEVRSPLGLSSGPDMLIISV